MKKAILLFAVLAVTAANAGVVRFSAKHGYHASKKVAKVSFKVAKKAAKVAF